jgi:hypothetical protein
MIYSIGLRVLLLKKLLKIASIKSDLITKYPEISKEIEYLSSNDPSNTGKYLKWSVKYLKEGISIEDVSNTINLFHKHYNRLNKKDINSWSFNDLVKELDELNKTKSKRQEKIEVKYSGDEGTLKIYEDEECIVLQVNNKAAACLHGSGTKWCITMNNASYYEQYTSNNVVFFYIISKIHENSNKKIAIAIQRDFSNNIISEGIEYFNSDDDKIQESEVNSIYSNFGNIKNIVLSKAPTIKKGFLALLKSEPKKLSVEDCKKNMYLGDNINYIMLNANPYIVKNIKDIHNDNIQKSKNINTPISELLRLIKLKNYEIQFNIANILEEIGEPKEILDAFKKYSFDADMKYLALVKNPNNLSLNELIYYIKNGSFNLNFKICNNLIHISEKLIINISVFDHDNNMFYYRKFLKNANKNEILNAFKAAEHFAVFLSLNTDLNPIINTIIDQLIKSTDNDYVKANLIKKFIDNESINDLLFKTKKNYTEYNLNKDFLVTIEKIREDVLIEKIRAMSFEDFKIYISLGDNLNLMFNRINVTYDNVMYNYNYNDNYIYLVENADITELMKTRRQFDYELIRLIAETTKNKTNLYTLFKRYYNVNAEKTNYYPMDNNNIIILKSIFSNPICPIKLKNLIDQIINSNDKKKRN